MSSSPPGEPDDVAWILGDVLGKGLSAEVRVAMRNGEDKKYAMKVVDFLALVAVFRDFDITADTLEANLMREIEIMRMLRHRNIIHLEGSFWVEEKLHICMEMVEGKDLLRSVPPGGMKEDLARNFFFQLCSAVSFCHSNNVIHGDLKPENILIREKDNRLKLIDFGFSHIVKPGEHLEVIGGTALYSPPDDPELSFAFDDWSCGIILYAMLTCSLPFSQADLLAKTDLALKIPANIADDALSIIVGLLNPDPKGRLSSSDVLASAEWLEAERCKELPETITTLALARQMSRPKFKNTPSLPISRQPSNMPLVEHQKDVKMWGNFLQKFKVGPKSKDAPRGNTLRRKKKSEGRLSGLESVKKSKGAGESSSKYTGSDFGGIMQPLRIGTFGTRSPTPPPKSPLSQESPQDSANSTQSANCNSAKERSKAKKKRGSGGEGSLMDAASQRFAEHNSPHLHIDDSESPCTTPDIDEGAPRSRMAGSKSIPSSRDTPSPVEKQGSSTDLFNRRKSSISKMNTPSSSRDEPLVQVNRSPPKDSGQKKSGLLNPFRKLPKGTPTSESQTKLFVPKPGSRSWSELEVHTDVIDITKGKKSHEISESVDIQINKAVDRTKGKEERSPTLAPPKSDERKSTPASSKASSSSLRSSNRSDVEFVMYNLKLFEQSEKEFLDELNRLFQFKENALHMGLLSASKMDDIIPESLKDIRSIHQSIYSAMQCLFGQQSQQSSFSMTDIGFTIEAVLSILISDRTCSSYVSFSKDFQTAIVSLRSLRKSSDSGLFESLDLSAQQIHKILRMPMTRLSVYGVDFATLYHDLDEEAKKNTMNALKSLGSLSRKCRSNIMPK